MNVMSLKNFLNSRIYKSATYHKDCKLTDSIQTERISYVISTLVI